MCERGSTVLVFSLLRDTVWTGNLKIQPLTGGFDKCHRGELKIFESYNLKVSGNFKGSAKKSS